MSSTPLNDRAYDLGLKAVANFKKLPDEVIAYYEQHLDQIPAALERGFVIEGREPTIPTLVTEAENCICITNQSLEQMIVAGHYDWSNSDITPGCFPITSEAGEYEYKLFHFDRDIESDEAERLIEEAGSGWENAKNEHLLAFGSKFPEEQRKFPIVELGSVALVNGYRYVSYLDRYDSYRGLGLSRRDGWWYRYCRFLAVRKVSAS